MISNLDESEFGKLRREDNSGATPRGGEFDTAEGIRADAPFRDFKAEAAERNLGNGKKRAPPGVLSH